MKPWRHSLSISTWSLATCRCRQLSSGEQYPHLRSPCVDLGEVFFSGEYKSLLYIVEVSEWRRLARFLGCEWPWAPPQATLSFHATRQKRDRLCFRLFLVRGQMPEVLPQVKLKRGLPAASSTPIPGSGEAPSSVSLNANSLLRFLSTAGTQPLCMLSYNGIFHSVPLFPLPRLRNSWYERFWVHLLPVSVDTMWFSLAW